MADIDGFGVDPNAKPVYFKHLCVKGCPQDEFGDKKFKDFQPSNKEFEKFPGQQPPPVTVGIIQPAPGAVYKGQGVWTNKEGAQIFTHPHYPDLKAQICSGCKNIVPVRPPVFKEKLSKEKMAEFQECFAMFDKDGDGTIDTKELGAVMRSLGQNPDMEEIEEMIDEADEDGSGSVNFQEFVQLMLIRQAGGTTREEIKQAFRVFDKDGSGYVSSSELKIVMANLGVHFTDDELEEMVMEADIDGDGQICFEEFYNMMTAS